MAVDSRPCDDTQIARFLQGELSADEQSGLELHLDACSSCREKLDQSTANTAAWQDASQFLRDEPTDLEPLSTVLSPDDEAELKQHVVDDGVRRVVELLAPTDDPQMLGRIGGYEVAGVIGSGGNGIVLKGYDRALNRFVAIKVLAPHLASSGAARKRFSREAQAAAAVVHDNVIAIHGVSESVGLPFLVMPYVRGTSLQRRIDENGPLGLVEILRIGMQVASGLAAAHAQGLVHRDIKPANILLADGVERVTITDFGLARAIDDASMTRTGIIAGTPQFMSPEQAGGETVDYRSDLFSLGSLLYAMCTGRPPFRAETSIGMLRRICESQPRPIREANPEIPVWLCRLITKLHAKRANDRFQSAAEVAELLAECVAHVQQPDAQPLPSALQEPNIEDQGKRRGLWTSVVAGGLAACAILAAMMLNGNGPQEPPSDSEALPSQTSAQMGESESLSAHSQVSEDENLDWDDSVTEMMFQLGHDVTGLEERTKQLFSDYDSASSDEQP